MFDLSDIRNRPFFYRSRFTDTDLPHDASMMIYVYPGKKHVKMCVCGKSVGGQFIPRSYARLG